MKFELQKPLARKEKCGRDYSVRVHVEERECQMWVCFIWLRIRTSYEIVGLKMTDSFLTSLAFVSCPRMFVLHAV